MKKALIFGAGNIGRGFIGQLLHQSGYEVVFLDINEAVIKRLNRDRCYPIHLVSNERTRHVIISNVRAVDSSNVQEVAKEFVHADIVSTSVGVNALEKIAPAIALGLKNRWCNGNMKPLNILICENMIQADKYLRSRVAALLQEEDQQLLSEKTGFVEASIGRMVPSAANADSGNPLEITVEEYEELPVDRDGFKGEIPDIKNMIAFSPFDFYIKRKIYVHNMGHTLTAFMGYIRGFRYIYNAIEDEYIRKIVISAYKDITDAMSKEYDVPLRELELYTEDLIRRFGNRALKDTTERVAKDPIRKLSKQDRFVGAVRLCEKHDIHPAGILAGIAAGFLYYNDNDEASVYIHNYIKEHGIDSAVAHFTGISRNDESFDHILQFYHKLKNRNSLEGVI
ncbi:MAG TPA: mannitol-1-phosphate 5-dehydrogenase [Clostridiales bacterium]|nr:mannitol-1-phosphate 5-dehydrogenase [Clostridiales bacterium]